MDAPPLQIHHGDTAFDSALPTRGIAWVLRWAAVLLVFFFAALVLTSFAYQIAAERALRQAAAAGLREAALPRATSESVESAVRRRLMMHNRRLQAARIQLDRGGVPFRGAIESTCDAPMSLKLSAAAADLTPRWLSFLNGDSLVTVRAVRQLGARDHSTPATQF